VKAEILRRIPLFESLDQGDIEYLADILEPRTVKAGTVLFEEGERGGHSYILLDGELDILKSMGTDDERLLATRGAGSTIGEMSLFSEDSGRTASGKARSQIELLVMNREHLDRLLQRRPAFAYEMVRILSQRLEETENLTIADLREKNRQLQRAYDELAAAQEQLIEKEKLEKELEVARGIQLSLLPQSLPARDDLDIGVRMVPMMAVGGDFYDVVPMGDGSIGIAVGDVAGHGVPAALFMALTVTLLRAEARRTMVPGEVLKTLNRELIESSSSGMFVTLLYGILDSSSGEFRYARAGHPMPVLLNADRELVELEPGLGQPLGVFEEVAIDEGSLQAPAGSLFFMYTDGVTEASNVGGQFFDDEGLLEALRESNQETPQAVCDAIYDAVQSYRGEVPADDDVTVLAVGVN
jgi:sigma-B regulation protein RsbU (phosphoserine phosphatase)